MTARRPLSDFLSAALVLVVLLFAFGVSCPVLALDQDDDDALGPTLTRIKARGSVVMAYLEASAPFSYVDSDGHPIGYAQEYADLIVASIRKRLDRPDLQVKPLLVSPQNQILLLQNGLYDFLCGSATHNRERQRLVGFSNTFFIVGTRLLVHKDSGISGFDDLEGKTVAVTSGTTTQALMTQINAKKNLEATVVAHVDNRDSFHSLETGTVDAFFMDGALLAGERSRAKVPDDWIIVGDPQSYEALACMLPPNDPVFKKLVDDTIKEAQRSGLAGRFYNKWFRQPIPPNGANLDYPMPDWMKDLFENPNDTPLQ